VKEKPLDLRKEQALKSHEVKNFGYDIRIVNVGKWDNAGFRFEVWLNGNLIKKGTEIFKDNELMMKKKLEIVEFFYNKIKKD
jgi:hypothetical protein